MPTSTVQKIEHTHRLGLPVFNFVAGDMINLALLALIVMPGLNRVGDWIVSGGQSLPDLTQGQVAQQAITTYHSPLPGTTLDELIAYQPTHGQSFGPETGNMRSYGLHGGIDIDCSVGGCAGADVAAIIGGTVIAKDVIASSANGNSYRLEVLGDDGYHQRYVHVESIVPSVGDYVHGGQVIAKVSPTDSVSTGPHLDIKIRTPGNANWVNPQTYLAEGKAKNYEAIAQVNDGDGQLTDEEILCGIGNSEGTRDPNTCEANDAWHGHDDPCIKNGTCPGRGKNMGSFSSADYATPEEADQVWIKKIRQREKSMQAEARNEFGQPLSEAALLAGLDLFVQSPLAAEGYVKNLPTYDPTPEQIIEARVESYRNPATGVMEAPGLNNTPRPDQTRRVEENLDSLRKQNLEK
ncbi:MAG: M23 family metallopeptidase [Cyanobacteria bacterium P01_F01_bin.56]